nr:hypothetical protein [Actinomycetota bacterium]
MKRYLALLAVCGMTLGVTVGAGAAPRFEHLDPGGPADFRERVPVNFVFVGYNRTQVDEQAFLRGLPD